MSRKRILIIEDEIVIRTSLKKFLEKKQYKVTETGSLTEALQNDLQAFALIITDLRLPGPTGTDIIPLAAGVPVLVMTSYASVSSAVDAMKLGAADYIAKPFEYQTLLDTIEGLIGQAVGQIDDFPEIIGECAAMQALFDSIRKVAPTQTNVLVMGESGTGKELVAKALHQGSPRHTSNMVSLNCAAIPETLIESELFGHEKGAFTGATSSRVGLVEAADGGTLFLDEIGELPLEAQARLLRVLQEGEIRKVGSIKTQTVSIRLIAATHRDLKSLTKTGEFREDLYYRLNVVKLNLPPLRERPADLPTLARHFLHVNCAKLNKPGLRFSEETLQLIQRYNWPGNIRELKNAIERAVILCEGTTIEPSLLAVEIETTISQTTQDEPDESSSLEDYFARFVLDNQ
ncbi:MAG: two-component system response regulator HydG, partial [Saprospiraceae bacterium]